MDEHGSAGGASIGTLAAPIAVLTTVGTRDDAERLARSAVEARLAACVQMHEIASVYRWQGGVQRDAEWRLLFKTTSTQEPALRAWLSAQHPYELPFTWTLPLEGADARAVRWVIDETTAP